MRKGFKYTVKYVKHRQTQKGDTITSFSVGEKIKDGNAYINFTCTVFANLDLADEDRVIIDEIESVDAREYAGKIYYDMVVKAHNLDQQVPGITDANQFDL